MLIEKVKGRNLKLKTLLIVFLLCVGETTTVRSQADPQRFLVKHVVLEADPNPRFVRRVAEIGIPWSRVTTKNDVDCIKDQLMKTGVFRRIDSRLYQLKESGGYELILTIEYESPNPVYKLGKIDVVGVEGIDYVLFKKLLTSARLIGRPLSLKTADYAVFEDKLFEVLRKSIADETKREWSKLPWIELKLNGSKEIEIIVMSEFKGCQNNSPCPE
jgi:hypothetical protein